MHRKIGTLAALLGGVSLLALALPASAGVLIQCQQSNVTAGVGLLLGCAAGQVNQGAENILFSDDAAIVGPASTVTGITVHTNTAFNFTSTSDTIKVNNAKGGGIATIVSNIDDVIDNLSYYVSPTQPYGSTLKAFTELDTNLDVQHRSGRVVFDIFETGPGGVTSVQHSTNLNLTNGGNKFSFIADAGFVITKVTYNTFDVDSVSVETVKQDQVTLVDPPITVFEPASLAMLGSSLLGFAGITGIVRRRRRG
jgi:hypothetical protein